jgi:large subunit ribosomal protein L18
MIKQLDKNVIRQRRHKRVRAKISGTSTCPRLSVFRSNSHISAQLLDDVKGGTLASSSSLALKLEHGNNVEAAKKVGTDIAQKGVLVGISTVVFDRSGYLYHGRIKALADAARAAGLKF